MYEQLITFNTAVQTKNHGGIWSATSQEFPVVAHGDSEESAKQHFMDAMWALLKAKDDRGEVIGYLADRQ